MAQHSGCVFCTLNTQSNKWILSIMLKKQSKDMLVNMITTILKYISIGNIQDPEAHTKGEKLFKERIQKEVYYHQ